MNEHKNTIRNKNTFIHRFRRRTQINGIIITICDNLRNLWIKNDVFKERGLFDVFLEGEYGDDHADENCSDETCHDEKHKRLQQGDGGAQPAVQLLFGFMGDTEQFFIETPALLRHGNHLYH